MSESPVSESAVSAPCPLCGRLLPPGTTPDFCPSCLLDGVEHDIAESGRDAIVIPMQFVGNYELLEAVGRGGNGVVYRARHRTGGGTFAVKMLSEGMLASREVLQRFRNETKAASQLDHPNIVKIHETGEQDGQPFFAMDFVPGGTLADAVQRRAMPPHAAAACMEKVARAIQSAHDRGLLHRDLKPANILMDEMGEPHVSDFGLAKHLDAPGSLTGSLQILGSPSYMAPEQATGRSGRADTRCDVYALGAVLYHLITGRPPFHGGTPQSILRDVIERDPVMPRKFDAAIPKEVETICLKCLEKSPARRYASAAALADDLGRHLRGEAIAARSVGLAGRGRRLVARHPAIAALSGALLAALVAGLTFVFHSNAELRHSDAQKAAALNAQTSSLAESLLWQAEFQRLTGQPGQRDGSLKVIREALALPLTAEQRMRARNAVIAALALPDAAFVPWPVQNFPDDPTRVICDARQTRAAALSADGKLTVINLGDGGVISTLDLADKKVEALLKFNPDGKLIAVRCAGNRLGMVDVEHGMRWAITMWPEGAPLSAAQIAFNPIGTQHYLKFTKIPVDVHTVFHPDTADGSIVERDLMAGVFLRRFAARPNHTGGAGWSALSISSTGLTITALSLADGSADVISLNTSKVRTTLRPPSPAVVMSRESTGSSILLGSADGTMSVWGDVDNPSPVFFGGRGPPAEACAWGPSGHRFACAANDGSILLYERSVPRPILTLPGRSTHLYLSMQPGDRDAGVFLSNLGCVQSDGKWGHYHVQWPLAVRVLSGAEQGEGVRALASYMDVSNGKDRSRIMGALDATGINFWTSSPPTGEHLHIAQEHPAALAAVPGGPWFLAGGPSGVFRHQVKADRNLVFDQRSAEKSIRLLPGNCAGLSLSEDGTRLAVIDVTRGVIELRPFDPKGGMAAEPLWSQPSAGAQHCLLSPDKKLLVLSSEQPCAVRVLSAADGRELAVPANSAAHRNWQPAFSPDNAWLALSGRTCDLYNTATWQPGPAVPAPPNQGNNCGVVFPGNSGVFGEGRSGLAVTGADDEIHLFRFAGQILEPVTVLRFPAGTGPGSLTSTPYGSIIAATRKGEVHIWNLPFIRVQLRPLGLDW